MSLFYAPPTAGRLHQLAWIAGWIAFGSFVAILFSFSASAPSLTASAVNRLTVVFVGSFVAAAVLEASATIAVKMSEFGKSQTRIRRLDQLLAKEGLLAHDLQRIEALVEKFGGYGPAAKFVALRERRHRQCHALLAPSGPP